MPRSSGSAGEARGLAPFRVALAAGVVTLATLATPAHAWTPHTQREIGETAARLVPTDLYRQIDKHRSSFRNGLDAPFRDADGARHVRNADGSGRLDKVIEHEVAAAVDAIVTHQPFADVVYRLGVVAHYVADANNPLAAAQSDVEEARFFADYLRYAETAQRRFAVVFYGYDPRLTTRGVQPLVSSALARGRQVYPAVGREYRRIGFRSGVASFDDRSTAFGVAAVSFSHAVSDVATVLRHVWLRAGGADLRPQLLEARDALVLVPCLAAR